MLLSDPVDDPLHELSFQIDIEAEFSEEGEETKLLLFLRREPFLLLREHSLRAFIFSSDVGEESRHFAVREGENPFIDFFQRERASRIKVFILDRAEYGLNIGEAQDALVIINEEEHKDVIFRIALLFRRGEKLVFGIVIDHRFRQDLVFGMTFDRREMPLHEGRDLIHIERKRWNL